MTGSPRGVLSLAEVAPADLHQMVRRSVELSADRHAHDHPLSGAVGGILFTRSSTRTRTAFSVGMARLGGTSITYGPADLQLQTGETIADTGRVLGSMLDLLVARTAGPLEDLRTLAATGALPVVNAMAAEEHPTQAVSDLALLTAHFGDLGGLSLLYVGEGNNTAVALAHGLAAVSGCSTTFLTPAGYGLPPGVLTAAGTRAASTGSELRETHDVDDLPERVDIVYTTRWQTTGTSKPDPHWRRSFAGFTVDSTLMSRWPDALFLHDLPAHRGEEVTGEVLDGPRSLAWQQAAMKLPSAMAVLEHVVTRPAVAAPLTAAR